MFNARLFIIQLQNVSNTERRIQRRHAEGFAAEDSGRFVVLWLPLRGKSTISTLSTNRICRLDKWSRVAEAIRF